MEPTSDVMLTPPVSTSLDEYKLNDDETAHWETLINDAKTPNTEIIPA